MKSVLITDYPHPSENISEVYRYLRAKPSKELDELIDSVIEEAYNELNFYVSYTIVDLHCDGEKVKLGNIEASSRDLCKCLNGCEQAVIFAATIGSGIDRLITKYSRLTPSRALLFQAYGSERIETLCDTFCDEISTVTGMKISPRFSAGYGDLPLEFQKTLFDILECGKIGLTLNQSLLMSPSKSVTAIAGLKKQR